jgi:hypothetical protein
MKTAILALTIMWTLFFSVLVSAQLESGRANPSPGPLDVSINSPSSHGQNSNTVLLNVSIMVFQDSLEGSENRWIVYSIDGLDNASMTPNYQGVSILSGYPFSIVTANTVLWVPDGWHYITVYAKYDYGGWISEGSARVEFLVGAPTGPNPNAPSVTINNPNNAEVFEENSPIPYSFTINIPSSWFQNNQVTGELHSVCYSIDNSTSIITVAGRGMAKGIIVMNGSEPGFIPAFTAENPTVNLTGTIPPQPSGKHAIMVYVLWTAYANENPTSTYFRGHFSVGNQTVQPSNSTTNIVDQPLTLTLIIASMMSAAVVGLGLLVYFKKRKHKVESL